MTERERLRQVVQDVHGLKCRHVRSERVHGSQDAWDGVVELFACTDDESRLVYAWSHETRDGRHDAVVLGFASVKSARDAVRAHMAADARQRRE